MQTLAGGAKQRLIISLSLLPGTSTALSAVNKQDVLKSRLSCVPTAHASLAISLDPDKPYPHSPIPVS